MKKSYLVLIVIAVILILAIIVTSVRKGKPSAPATPGTPGTQEVTTGTQVDLAAPKAVALKWRDAIAASDLAAANAISTEKQKSTNKILIEVVCKQDAAFAKGFAGADFGDVSIKDEKVTINSTNFKHDAVFLVKVDGNWMVGTTK